MITPSGFGPTGNFLDSMAYYSEIAHGAYQNQSPDFKAKSRTTSPYFIRETLRINQ